MSRTCGRRLTRVRGRFALIAMTILVYSTLTAADLPTGTPESVGMSASRLAHLDTVLEEEIAARLMPNDTALMHRVETLIYQAIVD